MIDKEALQLLLYAQKFYPKEYTNFVGSLAKNEIPWDLENNRFIELLGGFKQQFSSVLKSQESLLDTTVVLEQNIPMKEVVEPLIADLERAETAQKEGKVFVSNNKKIKTYIEQSKKSIKESETVELLIQTAQERTQTNASFDLPTNSQGFPEIPNNFFSSVAQTPLQKIIAPIIDRFANTNSKRTIIQSAIGKMYEEIQKRTDSAGELLADSPTITRIIKQTNASYFQGPQTSFSPLSRVQNFASDAFFTVFFKPELVAINTAIYQGIPIQTTWSQMSAMALSLSGATVKGAARTAVKKTGERIIVSTLGKSLGAWLGTLIGPGPGTFLGWLIGDMVIDKFLSLVGRGVSSLFNVVSLKFLTDLFSGNVEPGKDKGLVWLLVGGAILLFTVLFPLAIPGFDAVFQQLVVDDNAYVSSLGTGDESQFADCVHNPTDPLCSMAACDPSVSDCRWPTSGTITQGPFTTCGGTHARANAIDIGASNGTDIHATIHGRVTRVFTGCPDYDGFLGNTCGGYLGNHIIIEGIPPYTYTLKFGHLLGSTIRVSDGQEVFPTSVIGEVDDSGSSSGPHLHFSFTDNSGQGRSINSILPFAIDHCVNSTGGCTGCSYPAVGGGAQ